MKKKETYAKNICKFFNSLALISANSYSLMGPYEPKKPAQLKNKD